MPKKITQKEAEEKLEKAIEGRFEYLPFVYTNSKQIIECICPIHQKFQCRLDHLWSGVGCRKCADLKSSEKQKANFEDVLKLLRTEEFEYPNFEYNGTKEKITVICKQCKKQFQVSYISHILQKSKCRYCANHMQLTTEEWVEKARKIFKDNFNYDKTVFKDNKTKIIVTCKFHGDFEVLPGNHLSSKTGCCSYCSKRHRFSTEEVIEELKERFGEKFDYAKVTYINKLTPIILKCNNCNKTIEKLLEHLRNGPGCIDCYGAISKAEKTTADFLKENNIEFEQQKEFEGLIYRRKLSVDFFLPKENLVIECQGDQHRNYNPYFHNSMEEFEEQLFKDNLKKEYCKNNNLNLLELFPEDDLKEKLKNEIGKLAEKIIS